MSKTKLYFIPGTMCDQLIWSKIWPSLESQFELIHLPIPSEDNIQAVLSSLQTSLPRENVNLIGFSMGGYLATCLAEQQPNLFNKLLIISNSPCALPEAEMLQRKQTIDWLQRFKYRGITEQKVVNMLAKNTVNRAELKATIEQMESNLGYDTLLTQLTATSNRSDKSTFLSSNTVDIAFCYGDQDKLVNKTWLQKLSFTHNFSLTEVANCGHMLPLEQPEKLIEIVHNTFS